MIVLVALVVGAAVGIWRARAKGGNRLDMAQYAAIHAIMFAIAGLVLTLVLHRMAL